MKDYTLFDIADFVMDEDFIRWVNQNGKADAIFWENWLKRNPQKHLSIAQARRIVEAIGSAQEEVSVDLINDEVEKVLMAIGQPAEEPRVRRLSPAWKYIAAAVIFLMVLGGASLILNKQTHTAAKFTYAKITAARKLVENVNTSKAVSVIVLPDGSTVKLYADSRISYDNRLDSMATRDVFLSGQAFFNVKKDPAHPFRVFANEIVAKVVGTSFTIRSFEQDTIIQVTVNTGKVNVYSQQDASENRVIVNNKPQGIIVTPNQRLLYEKTSQGFQKELLENPALVSETPVNKSTAYDDAPVEKVFGDLSGNYGINIVYDNELLHKCTITANLSNETFYQKLDLICRAIGAKYEIIDAQVVIEGSGCQ